MLNFQSGKADDVREVVTQVDGIRPIQGLRGVPIGPAKGVPGYALDGNQMQASRM